MRSYLVPTLALCIAFLFACAGEAPGPQDLPPEVVASCPDWLPLTGSGTVEPMGWTVPLPEGIDLTENTSDALVQFFWDQPYEGGNATFQVLYGPLPPAVPLDEWVTAETAGQENLGRTVERTTVDLDGTTFDALRYAQGFTHGVELAWPVDGGFRSVTFDLQGSDAGCADQARTYLDDILEGVTL